ncbi:MAG: (Z)-2-((N-methylformamido)methylene)-5-hydroxybutyrolactone dehydrogenase [Thermoleophilaceae bacterium]|jgi:aldehyde dehydrogenase (NAD+)|nr:(Z)-2-((N-methylformamido)methylene)-5-hydroxybutyrolactone dehydrogenase [Thermoleophilaceae bacterium]
MSTATGQRLRQYQLYIGGQLVDPTDDDYMESINPATGEAWYEFPRAGAGDVDRAVKAARAAFEDPAWRHMRPTARGQLLRRIADVLREVGPHLAEVETRDNGKLIREMRVQHQQIPVFWDYFAGWCDKWAGSVPPSENHLTLNYLRPEPMGVVAAIVPWNSPMLVSTYKLAPALAAGNTVIIKPSEHTTASLLELAERLGDVGLPPGVLNIVSGDGKVTGEALIQHPEVDMISFTGSAATGRRICEVAAARTVPTHMELGGKSPNIVFDDADTNNAALGIVGGIFAAAGQSCVAGSRCFLQRGVYDDVVSRVVERAKGIRLGDPMSDQTDVGPIAFEQQMNKVLSYFEIALGEGADITLGGSRVGGELERGYYVEPTVVEGVRNEMRVAQEEIFGPVLSVIPFDTEDEVVRMANDVRYGLAAGIWTTNLSRAHRIAHRIDAGTVWVNTYRAQSPLISNGGFKQSGHGKENGLEVMREYTRVKSVWVNLSDEPAGDPFVIKTD